LGLTSRFGEALAYAHEVHGGQTRKGTQIPYVSHLLAVASIVLEHTQDEDVAIAALLHDAAEDAGGRARLQDIGERFGDRVAAIVAACSDTLVEHRVDKEPWRVRKDRYIAQLSAAPDDAVVVAAADKLHNARSMLADLQADGPATLERFTEGADHEWYYRTVGRALLARLGPSRLHDDLRATVTALLHELAKQAPDLGTHRP
jgi:(p)ppGpp synthase/HD superfamily hydrolase